MVIEQNIFCRLGKVAMVLMGQSPPSAACAESVAGLPFLQGNAEFTSRYPKHWLNCDSPTRICEPGDILVSVRAPVGDVNQADRRYIIGRGLAAVRFDSDVNGFGWHTLKFWCKDLEKTAQGTTFTAVGRKELEGLRISYFSPGQNRFIAKVLDTVDEAIAKTEAVIAKLRQVRAGLVHDLLTRGLDENGELRDPIGHPEDFKDSPLGKIPKEWKVERIGKSQVELIDGDRGRNYPTMNDFSPEGHCIFLNAGNVTKDGFALYELQFISKEKDNLLGSGKLRRGDIVITTRGTVGNMALYDKSIPFDNVRINSGMIILRNTDLELLSSFLYQSYKNYIFDSEFKRVISGSAQPQLPVRDIEQFHILKPRSEEQELIVKTAEAIEEELARENALLKKLTEVKDGLMSDLLTGRVRVPEDLELPE